MVLRSSGLGPKTDVAHALHTESADAVEPKGAGKRKCARRSESPRHTDVVMSSAGEAHKFEKNREMEDRL